MASTAAVLHPYLLLFSISAALIGTAQGMECQMRSTFNSRWSTYFDCPRTYDEPDEYFCCGSKTRRSDQYCCNEEMKKTHSHSSTVFDNRTLTIIVLIGLGLILIAVCYCIRASKYNLYRRRESAAAAPVPSSTYVGDRPLYPIQQYHPFPVSQQLYAPQQPAENIQLMAQPNYGAPAPGVNHWVKDVANKLDFRSCRLLNYGPVTR